MMKNVPQEGFQIGKYLLSLDLSLSVEENRSAGQVMPFPTGPLSFQSTAPSGNANPGTAIGFDHPNQIGRNHVAATNRLTHPAIDGKDPEGGSGLPLQSAFQLCASLDRDPFMQDVSLNHRAC